MHTLEEQGYIPLDKSWIMRMGVLDIINESDDIITFLESQGNLGDDLEALLRCVKAWKNNQPLDVGESGTLYRFLRYASLKLNKPTRFIKSGTLEKRSEQFYDDPNMINDSLEELIRKSKGSSQLASAALLCRAACVIEKPEYPITMTKPEYHIAMTLEAREHWERMRDKDQSWHPRNDQTLLRQAETYLFLLHKGNLNFLPKQQEDYCMARAFGIIEKEQGASEWKSLFTHESNRIKEMETTMHQYRNYGIITSKDHRVVQAIAMKTVADAHKQNCGIRLIRDEQYKIEAYKEKPIRTATFLHPEAVNHGIQLIRDDIGTYNEKQTIRTITFLHPEAVNKTWVKFWNFLEDHAPKVQQ